MICQLFSSVPGGLLTEIDNQGGYYILRAMSLSRVRVYQAKREDGKVIHKKAKPLSALKSLLPGQQLVDRVVEINEKKTGLMDIWSPKEKRHTFWQQT